MSLNEKSENVRLFTRILVLGILVLFLLFPFMTQSGRTPWVCVFHETTGLSCPMCGMSRSLWALTHFHIKEAFEFHIFGPVIYLTAVGSLFCILYDLVLGKSISRKIYRNIRKFIFPVVILWILYWLVRMILEYIQVWPFPV